MPKLEKSFTGHLLPTPLHTNTLTLKVWSPSYDPSNWNQQVFTELFYNRCYRKYKDICKDIQRPVPCYQEIYSPVENKRCFPVKDYKQHRWAFLWDKTDLSSNLSIDLFRLYLFILQLLYFYNVDNNTYPVMWLWGKNEISNELTSWLVFAVLQLVSTSK